MEALRYNLIIYDFKKLMTFIEAMYCSKGKNISQVKYAYILHDKDVIEETGELKKPHYHMWLEFKGAVKDRDLIPLLKKCEIDESAISHQKTDRNFLAYLTHSTSKSEGVKATYSKDDIHTNIDKDLFDEMYYEAVTKAKKPSRQQQKVLEIFENGKALHEIVKNNHEIVNYGVLTEYLLKNNEAELYAFVVGKTYNYFKELNDLFYANSVYNDVQTSKSETLARIDSLKQELLITEDVRDQLNVLEDKIEEKIDVKEWFLNDNGNNQN